jgi:hypothetical protein
VETEIVFKTGILGCFVEVAYKCILYTSVTFAVSEMEETEST